MVQFNSRVITGVAVVNGSAGSSLSWVEGEQRQRYRGGAEIWKTEEAVGVNVQHEHKGEGGGVLR